MDTPKLRREQLQDEFGYPLSYAPGIEAVYNNELPTKGYVDGMLGIGGANLPVVQACQLQGSPNFVTGQNYVPGSLRLWVNGQYQGVVADGHFTETGPNTFTFNDWVPAFPDRVQVMYWTSGGIPTVETIVPTGSNIFPVASPFVPGSIRLWVNGQYAGAAGPHIIEDAANQRFFFLDFVPIPGDEVSILYWKPADPPANVPIVLNLTPQIDGFTQSFSVFTKFHPGSLRVFVNGVYQGLDGSMFNEHADCLGFTTAIWILQPGEELSVIYWPSQVSSFVPIAEDLTAQIDGLTQHFVTTGAFKAGSLRLWVNGMYQGVTGLHFTEDVGLHGFTFNDWVPLPGEEISVVYWPQ